MSADYRGCEIQCERMQSWMCPVGVCARALVCGLADTPMTHSAPSHRSRILLACRAWPPTLHGMPKEFPWDKKGPAVLCSANAPFIVHKMDTAAKMKRVAVLFSNCSSSKP